MEITQLHLCRRVVPTLPAQRAAHSDVHIWLLGYASGHITVTAFAGDHELLSPSVWRLKSHAGSRIGKQSAKLPATAIPRSTEQKQINGVLCRHTMAWEGATSPVALLLSRIDVQEGAL